MSEKTFVFDSGAGQGSLAQVLPALLQNKGIDPSVLALMNGNGGFGGLGNNGLLDILLLFILFGAANGNGGFGFNGNGNNGANQCILNELQRNGCSVQALATALNTSTTDVLQAINALGGQICNVGYQNGQNTNQIITALLQGNNGIMSQIASCCCDLKTLLSQGFSSIGFETAKQTCAIEKAIGDSTAKILEGQRAAEMRELQRDLNQRDRELAEKNVVINNYQQTQTFGAMLAPIGKAIQDLQSDVDGIKCKLPKTETIVATPDYVPINRGINVNYGITPACGYNGFFPYGYGFNNGNGSFF